MSEKKTFPGGIDPMMMMQMGPGRFEPIQIEDYHEEIEGATYLPTTGDELNIRYLHDVVYATMDGVPLHLQVLFPTTRNEPLITRPCVVFVQGSAWFEQYVYGSLIALGDLAKRGYVVAIVQYRHSGIASFPAQTIDAKNAIRYMRAHAEFFSIDPEKIVVAGTSSGGHTALFTSLIQNEDSEDNLFPGVSSETKGIINFYGSVSGMMVDDYPTTPDALAADSPVGCLLGHIDLHDKLDLVKSMSVEYNVDENTPLPPVLMFHGTKDFVVGTKVGVMLYEHLKAMGKDVTFYLVEQAGHGGGEFWTPQVLDIVDEFIQKCLA